MQKVYAARHQVDVYKVTPEQKAAAASRRKVGKPNGKTAKKASK